MLLFTVSFFLGIFYCVSDFAMCAEGQTVHPPTVFTADPQALLAARASYGISDSKLGKSLEKLMVDANKALTVTPPAVTDKTRQSPSQDPHDFISFAPYYWLDPETGKYVRRDGQRNPEADHDADNVRFGTVCNAVSSLGLAFYVSGEERFATKAGLIMRRFFLDPATKMNPNLDFGQVIPGTTTGTKNGIISIRCIAQLVDAMGMLEDSQSGWNMDDRRGMQDWMSEFLVWLTTSKLGLAEKASHNNHGSFYDAIVSGISLFLGKTDLARQTISQAGPDRLSQQIQPDGQQPEELKRAQSFHYSIFNLEALSDLASMGHNVGIDLWSYGEDAGGGRSLLQAALEFLAPYIDTTLTWPFQQITSFEKKRIALAVLLLRDAIHYPNSEVIANALRIADTENLSESARERLLFTVPAM